VLEKSLTSTIRAVAQKVQSIAATFDTVTRATLSLTAALEAVSQQSFVIDTAFDSAAAKIDFATVNLNAAAMRQDLAITMVLDAVVGEVKVPSARTVHVGTRPDISVLTAGRIVKVSARPTMH
jgi:hypothetical protein